jgi:hypothetical protein
MRKSYFVTGTTMAMMLFLGACSSEETGTDMVIEERMSEAEYLEETQEIQGYLIDNLGSISTLSEIGAESPFMLKTEEYQDKTIEITEAINDNAEQARDINPPEKYAEFNELFVDGVNAFDEAATVYREAILNEDMSMLSESEYLMDEGSESIVEATEMMNELNDKGFE